MNSVCSRLVVAFALLLASLATAAARTIPVPWIGQKTAVECGRAVLASLAARKGGDPEAYYRRLPPPPDQLRGYSVAELRRFGMQLGVKLTLHAPAGIAIAGECSPRPAVADHLRRLERMVSAGHPIVVPVSSAFTMGHYLILVGASTGHFSVLDPAAPGVHEMAVADLTARMCDFGYIALSAN